MAQKIDPVQKEREEVRSWLTDCIDKMSMQINHFESEIETLHAGKKKKVDKEVSCELWLRECFGAESVLSTI